MFLIMLAAIVGGIATFLASYPTYGFLVALFFAPFGGSLAGLCGGLLNMVALSWRERQAGRGLARNLDTPA